MTSEFFVPETFFFEDSLMDRQNNRSSIFQPIQTGQIRISRSLLCLKLFGPFTLKLHYQGVGLYKRIRFLWNREPVLVNMSLQQQVFNSGCRMRSKISLWKRNRQAYSCVIQKRSRNNVQTSNWRNLSFVCRCLCQRTTAAPITIPTALALAPSAMDQLIS